MVIRGEVMTSLSSVFAPVKLLGDDPIQNVAFSEDPDRL